MPGFHFIHSSHPASLEEYARLPSKYLLYNSDYSAETFYADNSTFLGAARYASYPITALEDKSWRYFFEGMLYGQDLENLRESLTHLTGRLFSESEGTHRDIAQWIAGQDGDFILFLHHKPTGTWFFLNDLLGRLPAYSYRNNDLFIISRDMRLFSRSPASPSLDRMAAAEYLTFGFPLGSRTLFEGVERIPAATFITMDGRGDISRHRIHEFRFDPSESSRSIDDLTAESVDLFTSACRRRASTRQSTVVSLSGGLDSRSVAAGLKRAGCSFIAVTHHDVLGKTEGDVATAGRLARRLDLDWHLLECPLATGDDMVQLLHMKSGMNPLGMAIAIPFLRETIKRFGSGIVHLTGDGGDKALPDLSPPLRLSTSERLRRYIIDRHDLFTIDTAAALTGVPESDIYDELYSLLDRYPETTMAGKYIRFIIQERGMVWLFEGEDRTRCFVWNATPFYSFSFFSHAMAVPWEYKRYHRFYRDVLYALSPQGAAIEDNNLNISVLSPAYRRKKMVFSWMERYPRFFRSLKRTLRRQASYSRNSPMIRCMEKQFHQCDAVPEFFRSAALAHLLDRPNSVYGPAMENLFTLTSLIEDLYGDGRNLKEMAEARFM